MNRILTLSLGTVLTILINKKKFVTILIYMICIRKKPQHVYYEIVHGTERFSPYYHHTHEFTITEPYRDGAINHVVSFLCENVYNQ